MGKVRARNLRKLMLPARRKKFPTPAKFLNPAALRGTTALTCCMAYTMRLQRPWINPYFVFLPRCGGKFS